MKKNWLIITLAVLLVVAIGCCILLAINHGTLLPQSIVTPTVEPTVKSDSDSVTQNQISIVGEWKDSEQIAQDELTEKTFKSLTGKSYSDEAFGNLTDEQLEIFFNTVGTSPAGWNIIFEEDGTFVGGFMSDGFGGKYVYDSNKAIYELTLTDEFYGAKTATVTVENSRKISLTLGSFEIIKLIKI